MAVHAEVTPAEAGDRLALRELFEQRAQSHRFPRRELFQICKGESGERNRSGGRRDLTDALHRRRSARGDALDT